MATDKCMAYWDSEWTHAAREQPACKPHSNHRQQMRLRSSSAPTRWRGERIMRASSEKRWALRPLKLSRLGIGQR